MKAWQALEIWVCPDRDRCVSPTHDGPAIAYRLARGFERMKLGPGEVIPLPDLTRLIPIPRNETKGSYPDSVIQIVLQFLIYREPNLQRTALMHIHMEFGESPDDKKKSDFESPI